MSFKEYEGTETSHYFKWQTIKEGVWDKKRLKNILIAKTEKKKVDCEMKEIRYNGV